jgi:hypothetical protein
MVLEGRGAPLRAIDRPDPTPRPGEIRLRVEACAETIARPRGARRNTLLYVLLTALPLSGWYAASRLGVPVS